VEIVSPFALDSCLFFTATVGHTTQRPIILSKRSRNSIYPTIDHGKNSQSYPFANESHVDVPQVSKGDQEGSGHSTNAATEGIRFQSNRNDQSRSDAIDQIIRHKRRPTDGLLGIYRNALYHPWPSLSGGSLKSGMSHGIPSLYP